MRTSLLLCLPCLLTLPACASRDARPAIAQRDIGWFRTDGTPADWPFDRPEWAELGPAEDPTAPMAGVRAWLIEGDEDAVRKLASLLDVVGSSPRPVAADWARHVPQASSELKIVNLPRVILFEDQSAAVGGFRGYPRYASGFELYAKPAGLSAGPRDIRYAVQTVRFADESRRPETMRRWKMEHASDHPSGELRGCLLECMDDGPPALLIVEVCDVDGPQPIRRPKGG